MVVFKGNSEIQIGLVYKTEVVYLFLSLVDYFVVIDDNKSCNYQHFGLFVDNLRNRRIFSMIQHQIRLCGGVFLTVLLKSKAGKINGKDGKKTNLLENEVFRRLISIYQLSDFEPDDLVNFKTYTSRYKSCVKDLTIVLKANKGGYQKAFDDDVKSSKSKALQMMNGFVDECIDRNLRNNLVATLLYIIEKDDSIRPDSNFYVSTDGKPTKKRELLSTNKIALAPLLLGIWHYIIMNRMNSNAQHKDDYPKWREDIESFNSAANGTSKNVEIISPWAASFETEKDDNDDPTAEKPQLSGDETMREIPQSNHLPKFHPDTHFNIFAISRTCLQNGEPFDISVEAERLTQNGDQVMADAFQQNTDEIIEQIKILPCLFSDYGDYDDRDIPFDEIDYLPRDDQMLAFGYIEDITYANGRSDTMLKVRPRLEQCFPLKKLINGNTDYIRIGIRYPAVFFREGLTVVKRDLIAGLRDLGIQI